MDLTNATFLYGTFVGIGDVRQPDNSPLSINVSGYAYSQLVFQNSSITKFGDFTDLNGTSLLSTFSSCYNLKSVGNYNIPLTTTVSNLHNNNYSLVNIGVLTTSSALTSIQQAFYYCKNLQEIEFTECSGITNTTNAFLLCGSLKRLILPNITVGFNITDSALEATALNNLFTSLGTASGSQTITVTGNPGAGTCDTSIATSKGWTVAT